MSPRASPQRSLVRCLLGSLQASPLQCRQLQNRQDNHLHSLVWYHPPSLRVNHLHSLRLSLPVSRHASPQLNPQASPRVNPRASLRAILRASRRASPQLSLHVSPRVSQVDNQRLNQRNRQDSPLGSPPGNRLVNRPRLRRLHPHYRRGCDVPPSQALCLPVSQLVIPRLFLLRFHPSALKLESTIASIRYWIISKTQYNTIQIRTCTSTHNSGT